LNGGLVYSSGQNSDSGSSTLFMPTIGVRYQLDSGTSISASFEPQIRSASHRSMIMNVPYISREILLKPERVPMRISAGMKMRSDSASVEGRVFFESADNTPVITSDSATPGAIH